MNNYSELLPKMLFGEDLKNTLQVLPNYDESVRGLDAGTRLLKLMDIYKVFVPQNLSLEIYTKEDRHGYSLYGYHTNFDGCTEPDIFALNGDGSVTAVFQGTLKPRFATYGPYDLNEYED